MSKVAIVYWSGTGNTEEMAAAVVAGAKDAGADVSLFTSAEFTADMMDNFDASILLGPGIAQSRAVVRAAVIHQNDLQIGIGLPHHAGHASVQVALHFINRDDYADRWHGNPFFLGER